MRLKQFLNVNLTYQSVVKKQEKGFQQQQQQQAIPQQVKCKDQITKATI